MEIKSIKILFLEDSQDDYELNVISLQKSGLEPQGVRVETKDAFLEQLDKDTWDIILADYNLPNFNALEAYALLKERYPDIPMIIVTGVLTEDAAIACIEQGITNYVLKGNLARLGSAVKQALNKRNLEEARKKAEEELRKLNKELEQQVEERTRKLKTSEEKLRKLNKELEEKVKGRTAEIKELLKHKDAFIGQLGHDLKTPLTMIMNILPMIKEEAEKPEIKEDCDVAIRNARYIKKLVIETLKIAELSSPTVKFDMNDTNLLDIANDVIKDNQLVFKKRDIKIENMIDEKIIVKVDRLRIKEVFYNLVTNAVEFMPEGGKLTLNIKEREDKDSVIITVKDTGDGMTQEQLTHVFDEFYKADQSRRDLDSSGLGLAICKRIVEKHCGKIWVESPGKKKGTTFYFTLKTSKQL